MSKRHLLASLLLTALAAPALAAPPVGSGGGYYGGADYVGNHGSTVGPYSTYAECHAALQSTLAYATSQHGWTIETVYPCSYTPPYGYAEMEYEWGLVVDGGGTPDGSYEEAEAVLADVTRLRGRYVLDRYEAEIGALYRRNKQ